MRQRPIIFNTEMVRAILEGRKTQTRRTLTAKQLGLFECAASIGECHNLDGEINIKSMGYYRQFCPLGQVGDQLWVRETFAVVPRTAYAHSDGVTQIKSPIDKDKASIYKADWCRSEGGIRWKPSIHMPRSACRIILEITNVRVERLQDISEQDACAEGCDYPEVEGMGWKFKPSFNFKFLWKKIYGQESLDANPWVWVIEFKVLTTNGVIGEAA
ncbi:hypothetical protein C8J23_101197 [Shewanella chilikensis]|uniref:Morphogenetic protein n=1 Tax=Shewanella chilikensis TaxID=558541 RepID=A0ABX5PTE7_9GAMM|nr:hypothetical protein [Shewanella chilikensis]MCL1154782.1 hypothetical protein [Shewanella chilikensis]PYE61155.1 hypothetical protein C8J23_101197 [Shewanella chilikensis]GGZ31762.1 hypothetical protein GCM10007105_19190 [Shewanella chilikensis]